MGERDIRFPRNFARFIGCVFSRASRATTTLLFLYCILAVPSVWAAELLVEPTQATTEFVRQLKTENLSAEETLERIEARFAGASDADRDVLLSALPKQTTVSEKVKDSSGANSFPTNSALPPPRAFISED